MLRKDTAARFVPEKVFVHLFSLKTKTIWHFRTGKKGAARDLEDQEHQGLLSRGDLHPAAIVEDPTTNRRWWIFRGKVYWEDDGYSAKEVEALILQRLSQDERKLQRAMSQAEQPKRKPAKGRRPIPEDVRIFVWKRDGGRCAKCGSRTNLEYDHIVPISRGGSNTARNIELLCEKCNRSKGADLA